MRRPFTGLLLSVVLLAGAMFAVGSPDNDVDRTLNATGVSPARPAVTIARPFVDLAQTMSAWSSELDARAAQAAAAERARLAAAEAARVRAEQESLRAQRARASRSATRPRPQTAVQPAASPEGCGGWTAKTRAQSDACWGPIIASYGDWSTSRMLSILWCESHGNPWAVNASNHVGLFQIKNSHTKGDGPGNIAHAHGMWLRSGTAPWRQCGG